MSKHSISRRYFVRSASLSAAGVVAVGPSLFAKNPLLKKSGLKISLAQWSLHRAHRNGDMTTLDFATKARSFDIEAIEYVSQLFKDQARDMAYLKDLNSRAAGNGIKQLLIMIDNEGNLGDASSSDRKEAVERHKKWVEAAKFLGCHTVRVNAAGSGTREEWHNQAVDGLSMLSEFAAEYDINVTVENHGGLSSDGDWLAGVMKAVNMDNCGTLPDFGNFCLTRRADWSCEEEYDRYRGMEELMPFAKAVSAKSHDFGPDGEETSSDFQRMIKIVTEAGYDGYVGIEYEGRNLSEDEGIMATKRLLEKYI